MWVILALSSAILLGIYEVFKKLSVHKNAVIPVLFISTLTSALIFLPITVGSGFYPEFFKSIQLFVPEITLGQHGFIFLKSMLVVSSWILGFYAVKNLPITIVAPIRATGPIWTLIGAIVIFSEHLNSQQWAGVSITLFFFYLLSTAGKLEGINFSANKWVFLIMAGTFLGAVSGLYDKFLMRRIDRMAVQAWFSFYQVVILLPILAVNRWRLPKEERTPFHWRWSIPLIGFFLVLADYLYFNSLSHPESMISIVSALRRGGVVISFAVGALVFKEKNIPRKALYLVGILIGILLISLGSK
ncbi:MAG: DMT family transporter [Prolixibacteraceae bacterium]|nr:DMT family transporter [Prolixibacteraceae bacterium]